MTIRPPTTGNVQVNDVIVSGRAMNMTPTRPPRLSPCAEALSRKLGRRISNTPSRLRPNARKRTATNVFSHALLARFWSAVAEKKNEQRTPIVVNTPTIARQYAIARPVVRPLRCPCLTKKLTVIGTIGQTQGITSAPSPPSAEKSRKGTRPSSACLATSLTASALSDAGEGAPPSLALASPGPAGPLGGAATAATAAGSASDEAAAPPGRMSRVTSGRVHWPGI